MCNIIYVPKHEFQRIKKWLIYLFHTSSYAQMKFMINMTYLLKLCLCKVWLSLLSIVLPKLVIMIFQERQEHDIEASHRTLNIWPQTMTMTDFHFIIYFSQNTINGLKMKWCILKEWSHPEYSSLSCSNLNQLTLMIYLAVLFGFLFFKSMKWCHSWMIG